MSGTANSTSPYEAGFIRPLDGVIHAVAKRLQGSMALCGAGRIETRLVSRFDPDEREACPACRQNVLASSR